MSTSKSASFEGILDYLQADSGVEDGNESSKDGDGGDRWEWSMSEVRGFEHPRQAHQWDIKVRACLGIMAQGRWYRLLHYYIRRES